MALTPVNKFVLNNIHRDIQLETNTTIPIQPPPVVKQPAVFHPVLLNASIFLNASVANKVFTPIIFIPVTIVNLSIPDASTRNGNLFNDRFDKNLLWYLPVFNLLPDTDPVFSFIATQTALPNEAGDPFYLTNLTFSIRKEVPPDAIAAKSGNASLTLKEITLDSLQVTLFLAYTNGEGVEAQTTYAGTIQTASNGNYEVLVNNIKGSHVLILYEDLKVTGRVQISLSATYPEWRPTGTPILFFNKRILTDETVKENFLTARNLQRRPIIFPQPPRSNTGTNENETFYQVLNLNKKYNGNEYQLSYKISSGADMRPIIDVNDLKNLNGNPTEFSELKTFDLSRFPSMKALYIGVLSRVIIIVPRAYGIVRKALTCSATCLALVDTTPSVASSCRFQFQFELTPDIDPVDFIMLLKEIQQNNDLQSYTLKFADSLSDKIPSVLNSAFIADASFEASATPQNFLLTTTIIDKPDQSSVASANLFIQQLCHVPPGCVLGRMNLKLDDNFPNPVTTTVTLSLPDAISDDGIGWSVDADTQAIKLTNSTSFNFLLERYILCPDKVIGDSITVNLPLASGGSTNIPMPQNFTHLSIILDYIEQSDGLVDRTNIMHYMEIRTQDVQNIQYFIGVNSAQVRYLDHGIKQVDVQIILNTLSSVSVPSFSVMKLNTDGGTKVLLPLQFAVTSLPATINFSITFLDPDKPAISFTKQNDFITDPVFDLADSDISALINV